MTVLNVIASLSAPVIASRRRSNLMSRLPFPTEIAELVPSISEESRSEFASATPRNRYAPRNDRKGSNGEERDDMPATDHMNEYPTYMLPLIKWYNQLAMDDKTSGDKEMGYPSKGIEWVLVKAKEDAEKRKHFGYGPKHSLEQGLRQTIMTFRNGP